MNFYGIELSPLQALCRPGDHDEAEMHDNAWDVKHFPEWLQVISFYQGEKPKSPEASTVKKEDKRKKKGKGRKKGKGKKKDKGKSPLPQGTPSVCTSGSNPQSSSVDSESSSSGTLGSMMYAGIFMWPRLRATTSEASTPSESSSTLSETSSNPSESSSTPSECSITSSDSPNTPSGSRNPSPSPMLSASAPAPIFPFAQAVNLDGGYKQASSDKRFPYGRAFPGVGGWWYYQVPTFDLPWRHHQVPTFNLPIRPHPRCATGFDRPSFPFPSPHQPPIPRGMDKASVFTQMYHHIFEIFQGWKFTAVEVARYSYDSTNEAISFGGLPSWEYRIETVCYLPAKDDGTEGIPPLPLSVPNAPILDLDRHILGNYVPHIEDWRADTYRYCSVHLYFSSMQGRGDTKCFSYHNDKMYFNQMIELQLDVESLARRVAVALALLHWVACIDARGVQFFLFSSWKSVKSQFSQAGSLPQGHTILRVGHFEKARTIEMNEDGVQLAVEAVKRSLYIPRPNQRLPIQKRTWDAFVSSYIAASDYILRERRERLRLPRCFINQIMNEERDW
ncbi:hypothetical protein J3E68DRAFT_81056 [Trichoderma sp. SZMC 28012]